MLKSRPAPALLVLLGASLARADVTLLLEEPFGAFWSMNPAHSAIYLPWACAASPISLRRCKPGELGAVISRYHRIDGYDWIAIPLIPYVYAVERADRIPTSVNPEEVARLRDHYRRAHLESVAPDQSNGRPPPGDWQQLVGEAYDRTIYGFRLQTTADQDEALLRALNARPNVNRFNIVFRNCADFVQQIIDFYYPGAIRRRFVPELGIMTPRLAATCLVTYCRRHPELAFSTFVIEQVPGTTLRSKGIGGFLSGLKYEKLVLSAGAASFQR